MPGTVLSVHKRRHHLYERSRQSGYNYWSDFVVGETEAQRGEVVLWLGSG